MLQMHSKLPHAAKVRKTWFYAKYSIWMEGSIYYIALHSIGAVAAMANMEQIALNTSAGIHLKFVY